MQRIAIKAVIEADHIDSEIHNKKSLKLKIEPANVRILTCSFVFGVDIMSLLHCRAAKPATTKHDKWDKALSLNIIERNEHATEPVPTKPCR